MAEPQRERIAPIAAGVERPLWSVMIPTYNCADLLRETLHSVLAQDPGAAHMQIEVVDDASTRDDPEAVVQELGAGRVSFFRQPRNLGHVGNFNSCLRRARGQLVHLLHGDDRVRPGFYEAMQRPFLQHPEIGAAFCRALYLDAEGEPWTHGSLEREFPGVLDRWLERIASGQRVATPSMVVRRAVYERLGGFDGRVRTGGEDWEMWVRVAAHYAVWYEPEIMAEYRVRRPGSLTGNALSNGALIRDMRRMTRVIGGYLPRHLSRATARRSLRCAGREHARWAVQGAEGLFTRHEFGLALAHLVEAFRCSPSRFTLRLSLRTLLNTGRRAISGRVTSE